MLGEVPGLLPCAIRAGAEAAKEATEATAEILVESNLAKSIFIAEMFCLVLLTRNIAHVGFQNNKGVLVFWFSVALLKILHVFVPSRAVSQTYKLTSFLFF